MEPRTFSLYLFALYFLFGSIHAVDYLQLENGNKYVVERSQSFTWYGGIKLCADHNMSLLTPDTTERQLDVTKIYEKLKFDKYVWTSGQEEADLKFVWTTTGNYFSFTYWKENEPRRDGANKSQCVEFQPSTHKWLSYDCDKKLHVICEENRLLKTRIREIEIAQENFKLKIQEMESNQDRGGKLLEFEKNQEMDILKRLYNKQIDALTNELLSLKENNAKPCNQTKDGKTYNLFLSLHGNHP